MRFFYDLAEDCYCTDIEAYSFFFVVRRQKYRKRTWNDLISFVHHPTKKQPNQIHKYIYTLIYMYVIYSYPVSLAGEGQNWK